MTGKNKNKVNLVSVITSYKYCSILSDDRFYLSPLTVMFNLPSDVTCIVLGYEVACDVDHAH